MDDDKLKRYIELYNMMVEFVKNSDKKYFELPSKYTKYNIINVTIFEIGESANFYNDKNQKTKLYFSQIMN